MIEAVVFDMDGVLIDSEPVWERVRRRFVADRGGHWPADAQDRMMGMSTAEWSAYISADFGVGLTPQQVAEQVIIAMAGQYEKHLPLLPGAGAPPPGRLDVAVTVMRPDLAADSFAFAAAARSAGLRASVYLGSSGKLGRQLKWAGDAGARWCLIYGEQEHEAGVVTLRDMETGEQVQVPAGELERHLAGAARGES